MARLRTLYIGTDTIGNTEHHRRILILDGVTPDEAKGANVAPEDLKAAGTPPMLVFGYDVDIPEEDQKHRDVVHDISAGDAAMKNLIRKTVRTDASTPAPKFR
ncbi:hypothetical protein ACFQZ2_18625 [Streptomonospora algeriensis]|uniref:Uncharacterized protein n=1 Tax=Streptomonospora algeriensis TaxID=995084 RepID=A0ABW3BBK8_9ACTN